MVSSAEARGFTPDGVETKQPTSQGLTHEDLVNLVGPDYQQLIFKPLKYLKIVQDISELDFKSPTGRHERPNGQKSHGHYIVEQKIGNHRVYAYILKPEPNENGEPIGKTTEHKHEDYEIEVLEHYLLLKGAMKLILDEEDTGKNHIVELDSERNPYFLVKPRTYHHAEITDNVALVLVIMPDAAQIPDDRLHIPREELHSSS